MNTTFVIFEAANLAKQLQYIFYELICLQVVKLDLE